MMNPKLSLVDNLEALKSADKSARFHLKNGQELAGKLGAMSPHYVVIHELVGKEFYDALVRLDDVSAVSIRAR